MNIEIDHGFDFGGTGGKFREKDREFEKKRREIDAKRNAFREAARKKIEEENRVKQNNKALEHLVKRMQKSGIKVTLSEAQTEHFHYAYIDKQSLNSLSILTICDRKFLLLMSNEHKIYVTNTHIKEGGKYSPASSSFSDNKLYDIIDTQNPSDINKWAWGVFNTAIECDSLPHLKSFFGTP